MRDEDFEWDDDKAKSNFAKHGVDLPTARHAFEDPHWIDFDDPDPVEERYARLCMHAGSLYMVVYAERDVRIRIISARRANRHEQRLYFERQ